MIRIKLDLPGEKREHVLDVADEYVITVTRGDGFACNKIEAQTAMTMFQIEQLKRRGRKKAAKSE
jgi:hypothetical protein